MKKIIALSSIFCLLASIILVAPANAASISFSSYMPSSIRMNLIDSYIPNLDSTDNPNGDYALYTYSTSINAVVNASGYADGYINAAGLLMTNAVPNVPSGMELVGIDAYSTDFSHEYNFIVAPYKEPANTSMYMYYRFYLDNIQLLASSLTLGTTHYTVTIKSTVTGSNLPDPPAYITLNMSSSISSNATLTPDPDTNGLAGIIKAALESTSQSTDVNFIRTDVFAILQTLIGVKNNNQTYYTNLLAALNTNNDWLSDMFDAIEHLENTNHSDWSDTYNLLSDVYSRLYVIVQDLVAMDSNNVTWLTRIYNKIVDIYNLLQASETQAAQMQTAEAAVQNDIAYINSVNKPNAANIISQGNAQIDTDISSGFGVLATIIGNYNIVWILTLVMVLAFVSYLLYGKGV